MRRSFTSIGILCLILSSCNVGHRPLGKRDMLKYVNDAGHGLVQKTSVENVDVRLSFEPSSLLVAQEYVAGRKRDTSLLPALEKKYSTNYYFLLKFSSKNKELIRQLGSFSRYSDMLQVLSFQMQQYINLTTDRDTVYMSDYAFEQTYGMSDANTLLLAFPKDKIGGSDRLAVNLAECGFGIGSLKFNFSKANLDKIPTLDYTKLD